ncbi:MAG: glycogen debranching N-terminal domain-containing protein [Solirubrobacteraceae bacterium]
MPEDVLSVLDGTTFVVGDRRGDIYPGEDRGHGFFAEDTRFVSRWVLHVGDLSLDLLSLHQDTHFDAQFILAPRVGLNSQTPYSIVRRRLVDHVWMEEITVTNHQHETSRTLLVLEVDADFADLFEVKDGVVAGRAISFTHDASSLTLDYRNSGFHRSTTVTTSAAAIIDRHGLTFELSLAPGEHWSTTLTISPHASQPGVRFTHRKPRGGLEKVRDTRTAELETWLKRAPALQTDDPALARTYRASLSDLAALRIHPDLLKQETLPAAGLPWFMALFGRDSIITSFQALPYLPGLAATTLRVLASRQATQRDDFHEQEPGKILHELRFGELTSRGQRPHSPYFGSADATPLFLVLLDEYYRWTGDDALVRELEANARAALNWIVDSGDSDGDLYVEYLCRNPATGLVNQCWKDSWNSIQFADGTLARGPIATCEIQGYAYDAQRRAARLAREVWHDRALSERLDQRADALQKAFRRDFWMPEHNHHALALDGDKRQVDSLTSNIGHLLWSGILDEREAAITAGWLLDEQLYSGWGIRTLGTGEAGYNPLGYHAGTVWPHENSLIAAGLARYGYHEEALKIASAVLAAAPYFEHRLPEVFAGFPVKLTSVPVEFPTASRPQAWAAGAPLLLLSTVLRLTPQDTSVQMDFPDPLGHVSLRREPGEQRPAPVGDEK